MDRKEQIKQAAEQYNWVGDLYDLQSAFTAGSDNHRLHLKSGNIKNTLLYYTIRMCKNITMVL